MFKKYALAVSLGFVALGTFAWYLAFNGQPIPAPKPNNSVSTPDLRTDSPSSSAAAPPSRSVIAKTPTLDEEEADTPRPVQVLTDEELEQMSGRGDAHASYELFRRAWECQLIDLQLDSLSDDVSVGRVSNSEAEQELGNLDQLRQACAARGIRAGRYRDWLRVAAQQGNQEAMVQFASFPPLESGDALELIEKSAEIEKFKAEAMGFLNAAASSGNGDALNTLGHAYHDGLLVARDLVRAAAYMRAASLSGLVTSAEIPYNNWTADMTPDDRAQVETLAREIVLDCCSN